MNSKETMEDQFVIETLEARESLLKNFKGNAHLYFIDAIERDRAQIASGRIREGKTKDVVNPGQGLAPRRDPVMDEIYAAKDELSRKMRLEGKEKAT